MSKILLELWLNFTCGGVTYYLYEIATVELLVKIWYVMDFFSAYMEKCKEQKRKLAGNNDYYQEKTAFHFVLFSRVFF